MKRICAKNILDLRKSNLNRQVPGIVVVITRPCFKYNAADWPVDFLPSKVKRSVKVNLHRLDNPKPSRADRERLLWSQNGQMSVDIRFLAPAFTVGETEGAMDSASVLFFTSSFAYNFARK